MVIHDPTQARTQKARGILALENVIDGANRQPSAVVQLPMIESDLTALDVTLRRHGKLFARPCPTTPRHGFVDSRPVFSREDALALETEVLAADPNGEMVFMPYVESSLSAVMTPQACAIGEGNDGATQGRNAITLPIAYVAVSNYLTRTAGIKNCIYFEAVQSSDSRVYVVQARDGVVSSPVNGDYIPVNTVVTEVVHASGDALQFEERIKNAQAGTVLYHPKGSMLSHYSQHAALRSMPIIFGTEEPIIGTELRANVTVQSVKVDAMLEGIERGMESDLQFNSLQKKLCATALSVIHNASALLQDSNGAYLVGFYSAVLLRLAYAACIGEYRHKSKAGLSRETVYNRCLHSFAGFLKARSKMQKALHSFRFAYWKSGYGGEKWAICSDSAIALERALVAVVRKPSEQTAKNVVASAHNVVNCAHNNGPFLSKFVEQSAFDNAAHGEIVTTLKAYFSAYLTLTLRSDTVFTVLKKLKGFRNRKRIVKPVTKTSKLQFTYRQEKAVYHFQFKSERYSQYRSADIQRFVFPIELQILLDSIASGNTDARSFASSKPYWTIDAKAIPAGLNATFTEVLTNAQLFANVETSGVETSDEEDTNDFDNDSDN